ncbi:glucose/galactose MFS transporter [Alteromonas aestuariivivens]|uniref:Glucose/galactose MFS transporter n=1 Tax=Alteromonas aestuariivivens TaxID=1938339 RepID=A0A3D8M9C8_9ALTE|nr:glucose/galactose MFS transporter [Alteromonas aestuariivivens]RDV26627.1 glucose/galactose MFS transporter [Alteromonas aestuariivivens]
MTKNTALPAWMPMATIGVLFFIFGFITWLNGALIPFLQIICDLNEVQALLVAFCFYIAFVVMALPMSRVLEKTGYQNGMVIGLVLVAMGLLMFVPAAYTRWFGIFLLAQFVVGSGLTILQTAANPYVVRLGSQEYAAVRIAVMGFLNKSAGMLSPMVFTALVLANFQDVSAASVATLQPQAREAKVAAMADQVIAPYVAMAVIMLVLAAALFRVALPDIHEPKEDRSFGQRHIFRHPQLVLGAVAIFFYVGVEVIAGDTIGLYGSSLGLQNVTSLTSYTMAAMLMGYVMGLLLVPGWLSQSQALLASAVLGILLSVLILLSDENSYRVSSALWGWSGIPVIPDPIALIAMLGLANAMCWPAIWPLALADLGALTARGSAMLIMGIAGGAVLPLVYGSMAEIMSRKTAYLLLIPGYVFIAFYALYGHKKRSWKRADN